MIEFVGQLILIQFDSESRSGGNVHITGADLERIFDITDPEAGLFLAEEVGDGRGQLPDTGCSRTVQLSAASS